jgi:hypothetical protein
MCDALSRQFRAMPCSALDHLFEHLDDPEEIGCCRWCGLPYADFIQVPG